MSEGLFISGIQEKFPAELLKGRIEIEGNVIGCLFQDLLLLDEIDLSSDKFVSKDGRFYYGMIRVLRDKGYSSLDEVTILSSLPDDVIGRYEDIGGWESIQHQMDIINLKNFDTYIDNLFRENILLNMCKDGFNLLNPIDVNGKMKQPLQILRKLSADDASEWYISRMSTYGTGYSSKILEEEELELDDQFFKDCEEGVENGIPFGQCGEDTEGETVYVYPRLSNQMNGLLEGSLTMIGGYSSIGKSTYVIGIFMSLLESGRKILIISNEEKASRYKSKFVMWILAMKFKYYSLTKKKLQSGQVTEEDKKYLRLVQKYWDEHCRGRISFIKVADADMSIVKKKIREYVLRNGYDTFFYDTFKLDFNTAGENRTDLSLVNDSRELDALTKKYDIIGIASLQLAEWTKGKLFLDASVLASSKQIKEVLEGLVLMRTAYPEELDPDNKKFYCNPFTRKKVNDKWVEEKYVPDQTKVWRILFVEKTRSGNNSSDTGVAYLLKFDGEHSVFREVAQCRPKHGEIK